MRKGILHIGAHKTASTLLQKHIRLNKKLLRNEGYSVYFNTGEFEENFKSAYYDMLDDALQCGELSEDNMAYQNASDAIDSYILSVLKRQGSSDFVFSDERLLGRGLGFTNQLYPAAKFAAEFLKHKFSDIEDVQVVLYVRNQVDFVESSCLQYVRECGSDSGLISRLDISSLSWRNVIEPFESAFGAENIHVLNYDDIRFGVGDYIKKFFRLFLKCDLSSLIIDEEVVNARFSSKAMDVYCASYPYLSKQEAFKFQLILKDLFPVGDSRYQQVAYLPEEMRVKISEMYRDEMLLSTAVKQYNEP